MAKVLARVHQPLSHNPALSLVAAWAAGDVGSAPLQEELAHAGVITVRLSREVELWLGIDMKNRPSGSASSTKVLIVLEPPEVSKPEVTGFDLVLTWRDDYLQQSAVAAHLFITATPWLLPAEWLQLREASKKMGLGFLRGQKQTTTGHRLRHDVWNAQEELLAKVTFPLDFCAGGVGRDERNEQFHNQFVLVIENSRHENYFTEKLLDALLAECVPVYWGCPNIDEFFDPEGIIQVEGGVAEIMEVCCSLSIDAYHRRQESLRKNALAAEAYAGDFGLRLQRALEPLVV